jgi:hypothetical protein
LKLSFKVADHAMCMAHSLRYTANTCTCVDITNPSLFGSFSYIHGGKRVPP